MNKKKILYVDMDGVIADFEKGIKSIHPYIILSNTTREEIHEICKLNPYIFDRLEPIKDSIESVIKLFNYYDLYFLSVPMWDVPESFTAKRNWLEKYFGDKAKDRLILTDRKDLNIGNYLVDDRLNHGVAEFNGEHIHFGTERFPNWEITLPYLINKN